MSATFQQKRALQWVSCVAFGKIDPNLLQAFLRQDARVWGILAVLALEAEFDNLYAVYGESQGLVWLRDEHDRIWQARCAAAGKPVNLEASDMKGKGRAFEASEHEDNQRPIYGYIAVDLTYLPTVLAYGFPKAELDPGAREITRDWFDAKLFNRSLF